MAFQLGGVPKKGGLWGGGERGGGVFSFSFFGDGKLKFCKLGTL